MCVLCRLGAVGGDVHPQQPIGFASSSSSRALQTTPTSSREAAPGALPTDQNGPQSMNGGSSSPGSQYRSMGFESRVPVPASDGVGGSGPSRGQIGTWLAAGQKAAASAARVHTSAPVDAPSHEVSANISDFSQKPRSSASTFTPGPEQIRGPLIDKKLKEYEASLTSNSGQAGFSSGSSGSAGGQSGPTAAPAGGQRLWPRPGTGAEPQGEPRFATASGGNRASSAQGGMGSSFSPDQNGVAGGISYGHATADIRSMADPAKAGQTMSTGRPRGAGKKQTSTGSGGGDGEKASVSGYRGTVPSSSGHATEGTGSTKARPAAGAGGE